MERFVDQFRPMLTSQNISLAPSDSTVIRMPLASDSITGLESGYKKVKQIFERFMGHASPALLVLKSILQVIEPVLFYHCAQGGYRCAMCCVHYVAMLLS